MPAGKTMVNGTEYEITAGKTMITGTEYNITAGKTMDNGTAYNITLAPKVVVIKLSGNFSSSLGYVIVNGDKYTSGTTITYTIPPDSEPSITVYVSAQNTGMQSWCRITLDGVTVQSGAGSYSFIATQSYNITLSRSSSYYWTATITSA